ARGERDGGTLELSSFEFGASLDLRSWLLELPNCPLPTAYSCAAPTEPTRVHLCLSVVPSSPRHQPLRFGGFDGQDPQEAALDVVAQTLKLSLGSGLQRERAAGFAAVAAAFAQVSHEPAHHIGCAE